MNSGAGRANKYLQLVLQKRKLYAGQIDGVIGVKTLGALNKLTAKEVAGVIRDLCAMRMTYLRGRKGWPDFGKGWTRRVSEVLAVSLKLAAGTVIVAEADLPDPVPTVRGDTMGTAVSKSPIGKSAILTAVGTIGTTAAEYAPQVQGVSDVAPVFHWLFVTLTILGIVGGFAAAPKLAQHSEAAAPTPDISADNDNVSEIAVTESPSEIPDVLPPGTLVVAMVDPATPAKAA